MKIKTLWGILLLTLAFAIPIYGKDDCESCHKHHYRKQRKRDDYEVGQIRQNRSGYTYIDQIHSADYHESFDQANSANIEPFGPQEFEDYGDSEYEEYYNPYEDYSRYSVSTDINQIPTYVDFFPTLHSYPYYIQPYHIQTPFFGNAYGGF